MSLPIIFAIDDDRQVLNAITQDLKTYYRKEYRILSTVSANEALQSLVELKNKNETVALFISDQRMPEMEGVDFLEKAMEIFPAAKCVLLTAYSDTTAAIKAINELRLNYYLMKPWDPPEEKLYPVLNDLLDDWQSDYRPEFRGIKVIGYPFSSKAYQIKEFLASNLVPYHAIDANGEEGKQLMQINKLETAMLPVVIFENGEVVKSPGIIEIADKIGLNPTLKNEIYDVIIIGAGPAGLAASVYGASEGLKTLLIERHAPGGQAGTSSRIENYLGFPSGLSGAELTRRAITQATRFGTEFLSPQSVKEIKLKADYKIVCLENGTEINTRAVVITTGVDYRKLETNGIAQFTGAGIYYGAATTEAGSCRDRLVYILGGGNSAGQAAVYLSKFAKQVFIVIRRDDLSATMSSYLIDQIKNIPNIVLLNHSEIVEAAGAESLERLKIQDVRTNEVKEVTADALYIFIGAKPYTDWLGDLIIKDEKGYVQTGREMMSFDYFGKLWKLTREPYVLETSCPGIFAAGDVRSGAMSRVASAVGEGSMSISLVHKYLAEV
ncbi:thioredoxin reductase (NADPH) [Chitinophaga niastensis]|uniref:Thioredoxin reductase (NADPH) n=1 Tax=Chitinophaga niastensis TaxID=536980 RepID=A0A2P8H8Z5_CHINA|nr:FAD-dependent oxidoreductase [Chitinophaga niastensis]PSL42706.1 thioredoxin reductase (NADPH) [Chitinophaga niastensis]